ncbi:D-tyrosyl-tRNA(Tyr) deacylase [bacterium]|nr:D-tyrosyl-tRNA(Tyr) deacylase [bacterium]
MKIILQRVKNASVLIGGKTTGRIEAGYLLLTGFERNDDSSFLEPMIEKIRKINLFPDKNGRFAHSLEEIKGSLLVISQFTLFANLKKGKKPSWSKALEPEKARKLFEEFISLLRKSGILVEEGAFGTEMQVSLQNDGPVTIILDSRELFPSLYKIVTASK